MALVTILPLSVVSLSTCYLLAVLGAAAARGHTRKSASLSADRLRFIILVPAHNEERTIGETLASLQRLEYPADRFEVIVISDNCQDNTSAMARAAGATVYERTNPVQLGKGYALAWALERLHTDRPEMDAVAFVDADCQASPNLLTAMEARLRTHTEAVQVNYLVANPNDSWSSGLRFAAFALKNTVGPLGKEYLGLSCGLLGTGMGFTRALLQREPWQSFSLAEDAEYHMRLVESGERVAFAREAYVSSPMPTTLRQAQDQQLRWEGGRWELIHTWTPRLIRAAARRRDLACLHAALEPLVPPQSLLVASTLASAMLAAGTRSQFGVRLATVNLLGQGCYVVGGLMLVRAPAHVYLALLLSPVLIFWKLGLYARVLAGRGPRSWVRTTR